MPSERIQRQIDALLDEADAAIREKDWATVRDRAEAAQIVDPGNEDARTYLELAQRGLEQTPGLTGDDPVPAAGPERAARSSRNTPLPQSFAAGRYRVERLLGEGGRKRVFLAHDERLRRDVAFAVIKTQGLDTPGRERVRREAQAMARLGAHPNLVAIHDIGEEAGDTFFVQEYMRGGDLAGVMAHEEDGRLRIQRVLDIAKDICRALAFIHDGGIVHRDLKPGNVFLTGDGAAKLGDFGLAMAMDLSRLTQHGTFIGTVAYMAPEQAVGGDVDPRSDLYALGCVLYELVTGRVPFIGDGPTAVISQHLNTPPVAPSWHREDCPPSLERLIVSLLEKDPQKRPQDAATLLSQLIAIDPNEQPQPRSEGHALERLARGVFVGREKELERLRSALDEAMSGHGGLVMLVGEPGIGKTRTAQELETYARMRGAQVFWGRSHQQSGAPAFWPWVQVGGQWAQSNDLNSLTPFVASGGNELVRLFPALRTVLPGFAEPPPMADGVAAQFRLFDAYAGFVRFVSEQKPLVLTLDDLHWSDKPTLLLVQHLARGLSRMRCLVVCTYRDTDLVRTHPLSEALAELNRDPGFERIVLRGLLRDEVRNYIAAAANLEPSPALVERVYEETEGNPFFLAEVVNLLTQEGTLNNDSLSDIRIPDGVKEALGIRLDRLSEEANELLQVAAIVGREFTYDTLQLLHSGDADSLLKLIEEGLGARVIEEMPQPGRYRFTHALMQETLLGELSTTRRVRLHGRVGEALEKRWGDRAEEFARRLANHFSESATLTAEHAEKAFRYLKLAGEQAEASFAWAEAMALYRLALDFAPTTPDRDEQLAHLEVRLAEAGLFAGSRPVVSHALSAAERFRNLGDSKGFAEAVFVAARNPVAWGTSEIRSLVREALDLLGDSNPQLQGRILSAHPFLEEEQHIQLAQKLAAEHDIPELNGRLRTHAAVAALEEDDLQRASSEYFRAAEDFDRAGHFGESALNRSAYALCAQMAGDLDLMTGRVADAIRYDEAHHVEVYLRDCMYKIGTLGAVRSQIELVSQFQESGHESIFGPSLEAAWAAYSSPERAVEIIRRDDSGLTPMGEAGVLGARLLADFLTGELDAARSQVAAWMEAWRRGRALWFPIAVCTPATVWPAFLAVADYSDLAEVYEFLVTIPNHKTANWESLDAIRGDLALRLGRVDEAEKWYTAGLDWAERERCPVPAGRNLEGLAEVAAARDDTQAALAHLEQAAEKFRVGLAPAYVDRVVARRVELQGLTDTDPTSSILATARAVRSEHLDLSPTVAPDGTVTLMFSDIVDSTRLNERMGDTAWMALLREHRGIVEREVAAHHGRVVKSMGDGFMVAFQSARDGLRCAIALQRAFTARNNTAEQPVDVRIGLHTGEAIGDRGDFFGKHVNLAARVGASAEGGEILVSSLLAQLVEPSQEFTIEEQRARALRGLEGEHVTHVVAWG